ncbi:hypothetical protein [Nocardioides sp.]|uniref:hypothetical protein n=1 Tax=Nocardioides sp. TaxID=35761 RepID=UPI003516ED5E
MRPRVLRRRFFHAKDYALNDDLPGVRLAKRRGYRWIDLNIHVTAPSKPGRTDWRVVVTHWRFPLQHGWRDPLGLLRADVPVDQMTFEQVGRLRHRRRPSARIRPLSQVLRWCKRLGIAVELEAKDSPLLATSDVAWARIRDLVREIGVRVEVKSIVGLGRGWERLARARRAGLTAFPIRTTAADARAHGFDRYRP